MPIKFKKNNTTYSLPVGTQQGYYVGDYPVYETKIKTPSIAYKKSGKTYYIPCLSSTSDFCNSTDKPRMRFTYVNSVPTLAVKYNNTTYYVANKQQFLYSRLDFFTVSQSITRRKVGNGRSGYYAVDFNMSFRVKVDEKGVNAGAFTMFFDTAHVTSLAGLAYTVSWSGNYTKSNITDATGTYLNYSATCTITANGGNTGDASRKFYFDFRDTNNMNSNGGSGWGFTFTDKEAWSWSTGGGGSGGE